MSEHNYPTPRPEESPGDHEAREPEAPFITPEEEYHAKSLRYRKEALRLYFTNVQEDTEAASAERLAPFTQPWLDFETSYEGSFESRMEFVEHIMDELGWFRMLHKMATQMGIPAGALRLDYADVYDYFSRYFQIFRTDEEVLHVFARRGVKPMSPRPYATRRGHLMNEQLTTNATIPEHKQQLEAHAARDRERPDWRRLEVASRRFGELIAAGITTAMEKHTEIDHGTARCIAHVLGRAFGRQSALAGYGRTGEGSYEALRDEYLTIYSNADAAPATKELIDWLGTYLVQRESQGTLRRFGNEHLPPRLERLLVPTGIGVGDRHFTVHVPANYDRAAIKGLAGTLHELQLDEDEALQAFLSLPDVNAMSGDIMEEFHQNHIGTYASVEDAIHELAEVDDRKREVFTYAEERQLVIERMNPDYEALREEITGCYDIVEWRGRTYVFYK